MPVLCVLNINLDVFINYGNDIIIYRTHAEQYFKDKHPEIAEFRQKIYAREEIPVYKPGNVLLYRLDIWHRGTPVKVGHKRSVMNLLWKKRDSFWHLNWQIGWTVWNYYGKTQSVLS